MTIEEIRKGAPEGANGYIEYNGNTAYFLTKGRVNATWINKEWNSSVPFLRYSRYFFKWYVFNVFNGETFRIKPL